MPQATALDLAFHALSDPTRRAVLARLGTSEMPVSALAAPFGMALPSFSQHLSVLEAAGLITSEKRGRVRWCRLAPSRFDETLHWMTAQRGAMAQSLDRLDSYLTTLKKDTPA